MIYLCKNAFEYYKLGQEKHHKADFAGFWKDNNKFFIVIDRTWGTAGKSYTAEQLSSFLTYWSI